MAQNSPPIKYPKNAETLNFTDWYDQYRDEIDAIVVTTVANNPTNAPDLDEIHDHLYCLYLTHQAEHPNVAAMITNESPSACVLRARDVKGNYSLFFLSKKDVEFLADNATRAGRLMSWLAKPSDPKK